MSSVSQSDHAAVRTSPSRRAIGATCIGNAVEWYDFAVYGALGTTLVPVFFPTDHGSTILFAAFAVYGTAFLVRPLGAVYFGRRGDVSGRRGVLVTVILVMTGATAAVGLLPGYAAIGIVAPVALMLLRTAQGLAAGGELGVSATFLVEHAPPHRRGAYAAWHTATLALGVAAGLGVGGLLAVLPGDALEAGWWRLAFLLALPLGLVGVYVRQRVHETPRYLQLQRFEVPPRYPVREVWTHHRSSLTSGFALIAAGALSFNTFFVYLPNHLATTTERTLPAALLAAVIGLLMGGLAALALGWLSDRRGRRPIVVGSIVLLIAGAVPMSLIAHSGSLPALVVAEIVIGVGVGGVLSMSMLAEMFPADVRATGLSLTAGLASALVGGTAPLFDQVLFKVTGSDTAPAVYVTAVAFVALVALRSSPETAFESLD